MQRHSRGHFCTQMTGSYWSKAKYFTWSGAVLYITELLRYKKSFVYFHVEAVVRVTRLDIPPESGI